MSSVYSLQGRGLLASLLLGLIVITPVSAAVSYSGSAISRSTTAAPIVILQGGSVANYTLYTSSTSALVTTPTVNYPMADSVIMGGAPSGSLPGSVNANDSNYFTVPAGGNPKNATVEFTLYVSSTAPTQLNLTIVQSFTVSSVPVTIQVYNYTGNKYSTSGQGYLAYTSSSTASTDETKSLTITTSPQFYSSSGLVKIRIASTDNSNIAFSLKVNLLRLYYYQTMYNYVLKIINQQTTSYTVRLNAAALTQTNLVRLTNFTAWFNTTASPLQLQALGGSSTLTTSTGGFNTLGPSATILLAVRVSASSAGLSIINCNLQVYSIGTNVYTDHRLTFKIT